MRSSPEVRLVARLTFVLAAFAGLVAFFTGKGAEEALDTMPGVLERFLERHEDTATAALVGIMATGIIAAIGIALDHAGALAKRLAIAALFAVSLATLALTGYTANLGGQIRHPEVRTNVGFEQK